MQPLENNSELFLHWNSQNKNRLIATFPQHSFSFSIAMLNIQKGKPLCQLHCQIMVTGEIRQINVQLEHFSHKFGAFQLNSSLSISLSLSHAPCLTFFVLFTAAPEQLTGSFHFQLQKCALREEHRVLEVKEYPVFLFH